MEPPASLIAHVWDFCFVMRRSGILLPVEEENNHMAQQSPVWMSSLIDVVYNCIEAHSSMGPLGFYYNQEGDFWEIIARPTSVELIGGALDGEIVITGFSLDLHELSSAFERVSAINWRAHSFGPYDLDGPHISIEGIYQGHNVFLRVLSDPADDEEPGLQLDMPA